MLSRAELGGPSNSHNYQLQCHFYVTLTFFENVAHADQQNMQKRRTHMLYGDVKCITAAKICGSSMSRQAQYVKVYNAPLKALIFITYRE